MVQSAPVRMGFKDPAEAWWELDEKLVPWDAPIGATLVIRSVRGSPRVSGPVLATLAWSRGDVTAVAAHCPLTADDFTVPSGTERRLALEMRMPSGVPLGYPVRLEAAVRSGMWSYTVPAPLEAAPPAECLCFIRAFSEVAGMRVRQWEYSRGAFLTDFEPAAPGHALRRARLTLEQAHGEWHGELSLQGRRARKEVGVPLLPPEPEPVAAQFRALLVHAGYHPGSDLPRPAAAPRPSPAELPRPAAHPADWKGEELPRPAE